MRSRMRVLYWSASAAWVLALVQALRLVGDASERLPYDRLLAGLSVLGLAGCVLAARGWAKAALLAGGVAALYLVLYGARMFAFDVEPLLAVMTVPAAVTESFYVFWAFTVHELSHGEILSGLSDLFGGMLMPLIQAGVLAAAALGAP